MKYSHNGNRSHTEKSPQVLCGGQHDLQNAHLKEAASRRRQPFFRLFLRTACPFGPEPSRKHSRQLLLASDDSDRPVSFEEGPRRPQHQKRFSPRPILPRARSLHLRGCVCPRRLQGLLRPSELQLTDLCQHVGLCQRNQRTRQRAGVESARRHAWRQRRRSRFREPREAEVTPHRHPGRATSAQTGGRTPGRVDRVFAKELLRSVGGGRHEPLRGGRPG